jgi:hypothetical protein
VKLILDRLTTTRALPIFGGFSTVNELIPHTLGENHLDVFAVGLCTKLICLLKIESGASTLPI